MMTHDTSVNKHFRRSYVSTILTQKSGEGARRVTQKQMFSQWSPPEADFPGISALGKPQDDVVYIKELENIKEESGLLRETVFKHGRQLCGCLDLIYSFSEVKSVEVMARDPLWPVFT